MCTVSMGEHTRRAHNHVQPSSCSRLTKGGEDARQALASADALSGAHGQGALELLVLGVSGLQGTLSTQVPAAAAQPAAQSACNKHMEWCIVGQSLCEMRPVRVLGCGCCPRCAGCGSPVSCKQPGRHDAAHLIPLPMAANQTPHLHAWQRCRCSCCGWRAVQSCSCWSPRCSQRTRQPAGRPGCLRCCCRLRPPE